MPQIKFAPCVYFVFAFFVLLPVTGTARIGCGAPLDPYFDTPNNGTLPSNARGVVFNAGTDTDYLNSQLEPRVFLARPPTPLSEEQFVVQEQPTAQMLKVKLERVKAQLPATSINQRFYVFKDPVEKQCYVKNRVLGCASTAEQNSPEQSLATLIASSKVQDVTEAFFQSVGRFRVMPVDGFKEGHSYQFQFERRMYGSRTKIDVHIGTAVALAGQPEFAIDLTTAPYRELVYTGYEWRESLVQVTQDVGFKLPATYENYRPHMKFALLEQKPVNETKNETKAEEGSKPKFQQRRQVGFCAHLYKMPDVADWSDIFNVTAKCEPKLPTRDIKAYAAFLELSDELYELPTATVDFAKAKGNSCESTDILRANVSDGNTVRIAQNVCGLDFEDRDRRRSSELFPMLVELSRHSAQGVRECSIRQMIRALEALPKVDMPSLERVRDIFVDEFKKDAGRSISEDRFRWYSFAHFVDYLKVHKIDFSILMPMSRMLANETSAYQNHNDLYAPSVLAMMGRHASDTIDILLSLRTDANSSKLLPIMAAIAPEDDRVIYLVNKAIAGNQDYGMKSLAHMGKAAYSHLDWLLSIATSGSNVERGMLANKTLRQLAATEPRINEQYLAYLMRLIINSPTIDVDGKLSRAQLIELISAMGCRANSAVPDLIQVLADKASARDYETVKDTLNQICAPVGSLKLARESAARSTDLAVRTLGEADVSLANKALADAKENASISLKYIRLAKTIHGVRSFAVDHSDNIYLSEQGCNCVRKIQAKGEVTILASYASPQFADHPVIRALDRPFSPGAIAVSQTGTVYVADSVQHIILKIRDGKIGKIDTKRDLANDVKMDERRYGKLKNLHVSGDNTLYVNAGYDIYKLTQSGLLILNPAVTHCPQA
jgi:hypothetical protein